MRLKSYKRIKVLLLTCRKILIHCNMIFIFSCTYIVNWWRFDTTWYLTKLHCCNKKLCKSEMGLCKNAYFCIFERFRLLRNIFKLVDSDLYHGTFRRKNKSNIYMYIYICKQYVHWFVSIFYSCESHVIHYAKICDVLRSSYRESVVNWPMHAAFCARQLCTIIVVSRS